MQRRRRAVASTSPPQSEQQYSPEDRDDWTPFGSRINFDFAWFHFVKLESSVKKTEKALDLWAASILASGGTPPWRTAADMKQTIDEIQHGDTPWKSYSIRYDGPLPTGTPPSWMT